MMFVCRKFCHALKQSVVRGLSEHSSKAKTFPAECVPELNSLSETLSRNPDHGLFANRQALELTVD